MRSLSSSKTAVLKSTAVLRRLADGPASSGSGGGDRRSLSQEPDYRAGGDTAIGATYAPQTKPRGISSRSSRADLDA
jgi:hypothetical protein